MLTKNLRIPISLFILGALLCWGVRAHAAPPSDAPHSLNFSGYLTDGGGTALNGPGQDMIFELSVGGNIVWCAEYENITASAGMISVTLGAAGAQVGTGGQLTPTGTPVHCQSVAMGGGPGGAPTPISSTLLSNVTSATPVALNVQVYEAGAWQFFSSSFPISSSLFALQSESLGGGGNLFYVDSSGRLTSNGTPIIDNAGNWVGGNITTGSILASSITGTLPATVNGSLLTGITASQLAGGGTLPAENGSNLTNLNGGSITAASLPATALVAGGTLPAENASNLTNIPAANVTGAFPAGVTGGACSPEGAFGYDNVAHSPVYCSNTAIWTVMGGNSGPISGTVISYGGAGLPAGYLDCNGSSVLRASYANLFSAIGTSWGAADGTHFNLPDLRGKFLRGLDEGTGSDPDAASRTANALGGNTGSNVGTLEIDAYLSHSHGVNDPGHSHTVGMHDDGGVIVGNLQLNFAAGDTWSMDAGMQGKGNSSAVTTGISIQSNGGSETRPKNAYVRYLIKY